MIRQEGKQLPKRIDTIITEPLLQSQDTPTKYFTASERESPGDDLQTFKQYFM